MNIECLHKSLSIVFDSYGSPLVSGLKFTFAIHICHSHLSSFESRSTHFFYI